MARFETGEILNVTIDRFSQNGNGIAEVGGGHLNVGRVDCAVGDSLEVEFVEMTIAYCRDAGIRGDNYNISKNYGLKQESTESIEYDDLPELDNKNNLLNNLR